MASKLETWSKLEVRSVVRFLTAKGLAPAEIHKELVMVYGDGVMSRKQVSVWSSAFKHGRVNLEDKPRS